MRTIYRSNPDVYEHLFKNQVGHGLPVYIGRGGLGNVLSGLFRSLVPVMKRGGKALLREGVRSAVGVGQDVLNGSNFKTAVKRRATESGQRKPDYSRVGRDLPPQENQINRDGVPRIVHNLQTTSYRKHLHC